jgi:baculoviral IAP repeat-containing protein 6
MQYVGPTNTPYENGCFEFDIYLPAEYPQSPPLVHFKTTGDGAVRFNPNLYNCGKVCLSLLGTWSGPSWDPKSSTILQVLVSLQALIFVSDPYFNEPGYESSINTSRGNAESKKYNDSIKSHTLNYAILSQLLSATSPATSTSGACFFRDVITNHFRIKKSAIIRQIYDWSLEKTTTGKNLIKEMSNLA